LKYVFLLGRILFSSVFLIKSLEHFSSATIDHAASMGVPMASFIVPLVGVLVFLAGMSIFLGYKAKVGAWILVLFLLPTALMMHCFWQTEMPFAKAMHNYCFWKNISLLGAALMMTYTGSGPLSLDKKRR